MFQCKECSWWQSGVCLKTGHIGVEPEKITGSTPACDEFEDNN